MQQADVRIDALDDLAVELEHQAQHAVGRGVLGPEVDVELAHGRLAGNRRRQGAAILVHRALGEFRRDVCVIVGHYLVAFSSPGSV